MPPLLFIQTLVSPPVTGSEAASVAAIAGGLIAVMKGVDYLFHRRRDARYSERLEAAVAAIGQKVSDSQASTDRRCDAIERSVSTLSAHIIGPDGENGIRGDLREVKKRVIGLEERERDRLSASVGLKDRRSAV